LFIKQKLIYSNKVLYIFSISESFFVRSNHRHNREEDGMANVTLVGEKHAKKGNKFVYRGPLSECRECKVKTVCFNLEEGRQYEIKEVRQMHHQCKIHESGVRAVEYEKLPIEYAITSDGAIDKARITIEGPELCPNRGCEHYRFCFPLGIKTGSQYEINEVKSTINCSEGKKLKIVMLVDIV
jgi:uncharacterized protein (UPF0179 family)